MKKSTQSRRGVQDSGQPVVQQPEKVGWIRKFCGRGIFRELWRNRYVVLRGDHLFISDKEVKDERKAQEVFDLADYERSEELRKAKSRSKKNHSRFTVLRCRQPGNTVPNLVFLAVSPEEKESWVNALNVAIIKAKNRVLDEVTIEEDSALVHPTRDRAKIPHGRRLPTRGHLMAVASTSSHGTLTLDLVAEEDGFFPDYDDDSQESWENSFRVDLQRGDFCGQVAVVGSRGVGGRQRAGTDVSKLRVISKEPKVKTGSLPRGSECSWGKQSHLEVHKTQQVLQTQSRTPQPGKRFSMQGRSRCASMDEVLSSRPAMIRSELRSALRRCPTEEEAGGGASVQPVGQLQSLIAQRMQRAQELLEEMRLQELQKAKAERERGGSSPYLKGIDSPRLHHLRGSDSPHSSRSSGSSRSRSSDSPRLRGKDSPRLRGRESPRSKAKKNRSKGTDSPRSRGSHSPAAKANDSPRPKESPRFKAPDSPRSKSSDKVCSPSLKGSSGSSGPNKDDSPVQKLPESPPCVRGCDSSQIKGSDSPCGSEAGSPRLGSSKESPCPSQKNSPSFSGSFESKTPDKHGLSPPLPASPPSLLSEEDLDVERRRAEAERLLEEAVSSWKEAQEVLQEVKELQSQTLRRQRRRTYEKMTSTTAVAAAADEDDTPASPTSPEEDDESETP
ncbi:pleckstrin homology domain-containing family O member 1-A-like isoform X1 [Seriola lalandi dorsalis]|uniref:Pleckstrin homology domain containing, family O member 1a n=1 Tax=Seriola lalandi dorsalis TaxID=1841481 RepID=A0A3B4WTN2_SERLL|nr:pleckstrin homology domain-containing family O member 1-A-like isoform X1 [Seriola lalandi dorsalis]